MQVNFRVANYDDIPQIIALCNECFEENTNVEYAKKEFMKNENDPNQIYVVGVMGNDIVAHAKLTIIPTIYETMGTYAILNHVCVKPEYRRKQIGTNLLNICFTIAKDHNCCCVELWSKNFRIAAHALYKKYGFEVMDAKFFKKDLKGW